MAIDKIIIKGACEHNLKCIDVEIPRDRLVVETNFRDGFKYIFADGSWLLIRPSGTEPVLRLYSEAGDPAAVEELLAAGRKIAGV